MIGENNLTQSLFYNKVLTVLCNLWKTVLKVKNRVFVNVLVVYLQNQVADWELQLAAAAQDQERVSYCILLA